MTSLAYESLLGVHPTTLEYIPALATHWQISPDKLTYRFRINPNARFSDGTPVTADDVVATWDFMRRQDSRRPDGVADLRRSSNGRSPKANTSFACKRRN